PFKTTAIIIIIISLCKALISSYSVTPIVCACATSHSGTAAVACGRVLLQLRQPACQVPH
ncbi:hypothetical protein QTP86_031859, partial [Hemibagrus guttatus]